MLMKDFGRWSGTGRPGVQQSMGLLRVRQDCTTKPPPKTKHNVFRVFYLLKRLLFFFHVYGQWDNISVQFSSVQSLSRIRLHGLYHASFTNSQSLLKLMSIELVMSSNCLILCHPLLLLPSIFSKIRVFSNVSVLHIRWPKYRIFSFSISPSNEYSGLISFRMDWFDFLAVQGTLKSLLQHRSSKASTLQLSAFFIIQLSHPYMTDYWKYHSFD